MSDDDWTGYSGIGDYAWSNGNTHAVMTAGHRIRDHAFRPFRPALNDTGELLDCAVIGGGISGLSAAPLFRAPLARRRTASFWTIIMSSEAKRNAMSSMWTASA